MTAAIPKAELHVHLEGTATPDLVRRIAAAQRARGPRGRLRRARPLRVARLPGLPEHLQHGRERHPHRRGLPRHHLRVPRLVRAGRRDLRRADRVGRPRAARRPERRRALGGHRRRHRRRAPRPRHRGAHPQRGACATSASSAPIEIAEHTAARPHPYVVGFSLAGDEAGYPPEPYLEAYRIAADAGLGCTVHAGEWAGPASVRGGARAARHAHRPRRARDRGPRAGRRARAPADHARGVPHEQRRPRGLPYATRSTRFRSCARPGSRSRSAPTTRRTSAPASAGEYAIAA